MADGLHSELVKQVAKPLYQDAIAPGAIEVGKSLSTLGRTVNVLLAPLRAMVWGSEALEGWVNTKVAEKLASRGAKHVQAPDPRVAVPCLTSVRLCDAEPELQDMFAGLLAASMDADAANDVHPSYVEVLRQCSSLDAQVLRLLCIRGTHPAVKPLIMNATEPNVVRFPPPPGWRIDPGKVFAFPSLLETEGDRIPVSIDNLSRLGVLAIRDGKIHDYHTEYVELGNTKCVRHAIAQLRPRLAEHPDGKLMTMDAAVTLTSFGDGLISVIKPVEDRSS